MAQATWEFKVDTKRDGTYAASIDDLTSRLIGQATFNVGMNDATQDFANPSQLSIVLNNIDGAFNPDTLGAELLANNTFATWSGNNPSSWTVTGEVGTNPEISQVRADALHGGTGTGACNIYSTSAVVSISQTVLTIGTTYRVTLDISASSVGTGWIAVYDNSTRVSPIYHYTGSYTFYFNATSTTFKIASSGSVDMTVDNVSVKASSLYGQLLAEGTLGRLQATFNAVTYTKFIGRLVSFQPIPGSNNRRVIAMTFSDPTLDLLDTEYNPVLDTDVTADVPIQRVLDEAVVPFPYAHSYWMLGVQGASELDQTTTLYTPPSYSLDTGKTTFNFVGDNAREGNQGISAQNYLRELVTGEIYGRFFYDPSLPGYQFHSRHRDPLNTTVAYTVTDSDYEPDMSSYVRMPVLNKSSVSYTPRKLGTPGTVIWAADDLPISMTEDGHKITARYRDVDNPSARIGAIDVIQLKPVTDYSATYLPDNSDVTNVIGLTMQIGANSAEITISKPQRYVGEISITALQLRGTPLTTFNPRVAESVNGDSVYSYKVAPERVSYSLVDTDNDAQAIADYRVYKNSTALTAFDKLGWVANKTTARMTNALASEIGDRITVSDSWLGHSADYFIAGMHHTIVWGGEHTHNVSLTLKPAERENFWILNTSALGTNTRLGL